MDTFVAVQQRRRNLRIVLFVIILATLPFYCAGILLLGTAPQNGAAAAASRTPTYTPIARTGTVTITPRPSNTPFSLTATQLSPLLPTPGQFQPVATRYLSPTPFIMPTNIVLPTSTPAPTLTPYPTNQPAPTSVPPTQTPFPTLEPLPTQAPPTNAPPPTETTPPDVLIPPSDTPQPVDPGDGGGGESGGDTTGG